MKQSQLKSTNNNDNDVEVVDAEVEGATANEIKWSLCRPEALGMKVNLKCGVTSRCSIMGPIQIRRAMLHAYSVSRQRVMIAAPFVQRAATPLA
jgi:hypothetical protein